MRPLLIAAIGLALACGGSAPSDFAPISSSGDLSTGLNGTWTGPTSVAFQGVSPVSYTGQLIVSVSGRTATVSQVCPDGSGTVTATGGGPSATWSGTLTCPAVALAGCAAVTLKYESANVLLNSATSLTAQGAGSGSGCGVTRAMAVTFSGSK